MIVALAGICILLAAALLYQLVLVPKMTPSSTTASTTSTGKQQTSQQAPQLTPGQLQSDSSPAVLSERGNRSYDAFISDANSAMKAQQNGQDTSALRGKLQQDLNDAETAYKQWIAASPNDRAGYAHLAWLYVAGGSLLSPSYYQEAIDTGKKWEASHADGADVLTAMGRAYLGTGDRATALDLAKKALVLAPDYQEAKQLLSDLHQ